MPSNGSPAAIPNTTGFRWHPRPLSPPGTGRHAIPAGHPRDFLGAPERVASDRRRLGTGLGASQVSSTRWLAGISVRPFFGISHSIQ